MFNPYTVQGGTATMESTTPNTNGQSRTPDFFGTTTPQSYIPTNPMTGVPMFNPTMQYPAYAQPFVGAVNPAFCGVPNYGIPAYGTPAYGYQNFAPTVPCNTFAPSFAGHQVNPFWQNPSVNNPYATIGSVPTCGMPSVYNTPFAAISPFAAPWANTIPWANTTPYINHTINPFINTTVNPYVNPAINPFVGHNIVAPTIPGCIPSPITPGFFRAPVVGYPHNTVAAGIPANIFNSSPIANPLLAASIYSNPVSPFFANPQAWAMTNPLAQLGTIAALNNIASVNGAVSPVGVNPIAAISALQSNVLGNTTINPWAATIAALNQTCATTPWTGLNNTINPFGVAGILNNPAALTTILGAISNPFSSTINPLMNCNTGIGGLGSPFGANPLVANPWNASLVNPACWTGCCI